MAEGLPPIAADDVSAFAFRLSAPDRSIAREVQIGPQTFGIAEAGDGVHPRDGATMHRFELNGRSHVEQRGTKRSQRAERCETRASEQANTGTEMIWYGWSIYIDRATLNPDATTGRNPAKLHLGQFHQRGADGQSAKPALMFNLSGDGDLVAQFEHAVGKRRHVLVPGGDDGSAAKGMWVDIVVGARWSDADAVTDIRVRLPGEDRYRRVVLDRRPNTSTGQVFFKYGVYRSFLERDPALERSRSIAYFDGLRRGQRPAEVMLPPLAPATEALALDWAAGPPQPG